MDSPSECGEPANGPGRAGNGRRSEASGGYHRIRAELGKMIVGQDAVIEELPHCAILQGPVRFGGVAGLAKTS